jgi:hypothetical protein
MMVTKVLCQSLGTYPLKFHGSSESNQAERVLGLGWYEGSLRKGKEGKAGREHCWTQKGKRLVTQEAEIRRIGIQSQS